MRILINWLTLAVLMISCDAFSQNYKDHPEKIAFNEIAAWVVKRHFSQDIATNDVRNVDYLLYDHQVNLLGSKKHTFFQFARRVNNQAGLSEATQLDVGFVPAYEKLVIHHLNIIRDGKTLDRLNKDNVKLFQQEDQLDLGLYQEQWQAMLIPEDIRVGDTIVYAYSLIGSNPVLGDKFFGGSSLNWGVPLANYYFKLSAPAQKHLAYQVQNAKVDVKEAIAEGVRTLEIEQSNVAPVKNEDQYPSWFNPYGFLQFSQYKDWQEVNEWALAMYPGTAKLPPELVKLLSQQQFDDKLEAISFVTRWIQDNIRYFGVEVGVNSHQPSKPIDTLTRRYGDCKDKTVLLNTALRHLNIDAYPALVSTELTQSLTKYLPSPGLFNHVISYFEHEGKAYWVDATMNGQKGRVDQNSFPDLDWGFVVRPNATGLTKMEAVTAQQTTGSIDLQETFTLGKHDEPATVRIKTLFGGYKAGQLRQYFSSAGSTVATQNYLNYYARHFDKVEVLSALKYADTKDNQLLVEVAFKVHSMQKSTTSRNELTLYASEIIDQVQLPKVRQRDYPFALSKHLTISHKLTIVPNDMKDVIWRGDHQPVKVTNDWFDYSHAVVKSDDKIAIEYHFESLKENVAAKDFSRYVSSIDEIDPSLGFSLWLHKEKDQRARQRKENVSNLLKGLIKR